MPLTVNGIDLSQPPQGQATTVAVRANFAAIDTALSNLTAAFQAGVTIAPVLSAIAAIPATQLGTIEKTGSTTAGTYTVTAFAKTLLATADPPTFQTTLGLGSAATQAASAFALASHTHNAFAVPLFVPDTGSGGTQGLVPAPPAGATASGAVLRADGTWGGISGTLSGNLSGGGRTISNMILNNYSETYATLGNLTGSVSINFTTSYQTGTLTGNTTITFTGFPNAGTTADAIILLIKQDTVGGRTITFSGVRWANGTAPSVAAAANAITILSFISGIDGTQTVYGFLGGLSFA